MVEQDLQQLKESCLASAPYTRLFLKDDSYPSEIFDSPLGDRIINKFLDKYGNGTLVAAHALASGVGLYSLSERKNDDAATLAAALVVMGTELRSEELVGLFLGDIQSKVENMSNDVGIDTRDHLNIKLAFMMELGRSMDQSQTVDLSYLKPLSLKLVHEFGVSTLALPYLYADAMRIFNPNCIQAEHIEIVGRALEEGFLLGDYKLLPDCVKDTSQLFRSMYAVDGGVATESTNYLEDIIATIMLCGVALSEVGNSIIPECKEGIDIKAEIEHREMLAREDGMEE